MGNNSQIGKAQIGSAWIGSSGVTPNLTPATTYLIKGSLVTTGLDCGSIPTQNFTGQFTLSGPGPIHKMSDGTISSFSVTISTAPGVVTNPFPTATFIATSTDDIRFDATTNLLSANDSISPVSLVSSIVSGTCGVSTYPFTIIWVGQPTIVNVPAPTSVNPVEGVEAAGTYFFTQGIGPTAGAAILSPNYIVILPGCVSSCQRPTFQKCF